MAQPRKVGGSLRLTLNETVVASWRDLNPTEQYLALLEAWLNRANEDQIFDQRGKAFDGNLQPALTLITETQLRPWGLNSTTAIVGSSSVVPGNFTWLSCGCLGS
jgi:hypothetical protein